MLPDKDTLAEEYTIVVRELLDCDANALGEIDGKNDLDADVGYGWESEFVNTDAVWLEAFSRFGVVFDASNPEHIALRDAAWVQTAKTGFSST